MKVPLNPLYQVIQHCLMKGLIMEKRLAHIVKLANFQVIILSVFIFFQSSDCLLVIGW